MIPEAVGGSIGGHQPPFPRSEARGSLTSDAERRRDAARAYCGAVTQATFESLYAPIVPSNIHVEQLVADVLIPGMGQKTHETCGDPNWFTQTVCCPVDSSHSRRVVGGTTCGNPSCPVCYAAWLSRAADRVGCRVEGFRQFDRYPPRHVVLSVRDGDLDFEALRVMTAKRCMKKLQQYFRKRAVEEGCNGGAQVIHLHRTSDEVPRDLSQKKWDWVRSQGAEHFGELVVFSPHAHLATYGYLRRVERGEDDFRYVNLGALKTRDDIERWAYYALSHAPVIEGMHAVTYFGTCSYSQLKPTWRSVSHTESRCPVCGAVMIIEGTNEVYMTVRSESGWVRALPRSVVGCDPPRGGC